jgi:hypothetical protein
LDGAIERLSKSFEMLHVVAVSREFHLLANLVSQRIAADDKSNI